MAPFFQIFDCVKNEIFHLNVHHLFVSTSSELTWRVVIKGARLIILKYSNFNFYGHNYLLTINYCRIIWQISRSHLAVEK